MLVLPFPLDFLQGELINYKIKNEQVGDVPLLIARQREMGISELIDKHYQPHGNWQGASYGELTEVWLSYILSEGDHRLNRMESWYTERQATINHYVNGELTPNDFRDDRLAILLNELSDDAKWGAFEKDLNQKTIRVYKLVQGGGNKYAKSRRERASLVGPFKGLSESTVEIRNEIKKALP